MKVKEIIEIEPTIVSGSTERKKTVLSFLLYISEYVNVELLKISINSILAQTFREIDIVAIDDSSNSNVRKLLNTFVKQDNRFAYISSKKSIGIAEIGYAQAYINAMGDYFVFATPTMVWNTTAAQSMLRFMVDNQLEATYGEVTIKNIFTSPNQTATNLLDIGCYDKLSSNCLFFHKKVGDLVGLLDPSIGLCGYSLWDLIQRIRDRFRLEVVNTNLGEVQQKKSYFFTDCWTASEHMNVLRDRYLTPDTIYDYDIISLFSDKSSYFTEIMMKNLLMLQDKSWYNAKLMVNLELCLVNTRKFKRVIIFSEEYLDAPTTLYFERLRKHLDYILVFCVDNTAKKMNMLMADVAIFVKSLAKMTPFIQNANLLSIPCYYFIDDNFIELSKDYPKNSYFSEYAALTTAENLEKFDGILLSTPQLHQYFKTKNLHPNLILFEPVIDQSQVNRHPMERSKNYLSVAFFGGTFRVKAVTNYVIPALKLLSEQVEIQFYCPEGEIDAKGLSTERFRVIPIPRAYSLDLALKRYSIYDIDIQVHCGENIRNNIYKSINSLINSTQLGAVLIASNLEPFTSTIGIDRTCLLAENSITGWYNQLKRVYEDPFLKTNLFMAAKQYCDSRFSPMKRANTLSDLVKSHSYTEYIDIILRYKALLRLSGGESNIELTLQSEGFRKYAKAYGWKLPFVAIKKIFRR